MTNLPYHIDIIFLNKYFRSNTALKMQPDFKCIYLPKMDQSLRTKILGTSKNIQKILYLLPTFIA